MLSDQKVLQEKLTALLAQCPPLKPVLSSTLDLPIEVTRWGTSGPRVVLVHGGLQGDLGGGPATFDGQEQLGSRGWQVWRVTRPGFGNTPSRGIVDMDAESKWIAEMLGSGANLIGHSWGGGEALLAVTCNPGAVKTLILVEPAIESLVPPSKDEPEMVRLDRMSRLQAMAAATTPAELARAVGAALNGDGSSETARKMAARLADPEMATSTGCEILRSRQATADQFSAAADVVIAAKIPVLVISGGWSASTDAAADRVATRLNGRHAIVRSSDHYVMADDVAAFNDVVDAFMRSANQ